VLLLHGLIEAYFHFFFVITVIALVSGLDRLPPGHRARSTKAR
jgi:hypothetical protein